MSYYERINGYIIFNDKKDKESFIEKQEYLDIVCEHDTVVAVYAYENNIVDYIKETLSKYDCEVDIVCEGEDGEKYKLKKDMHSPSFDIIPSLTIYPDEERTNIEEFVNSIDCSKTDKEKLVNAILKYDFSEV